MKNITSFLENERNELIKLSESVSSEYKDEAIRSFTNSPYLPKNCLELLVLTGMSTNTEIFQNLALVAYDSFIKCYLSEFASYVLRIASDGPTNEHIFPSGELSLPERMIEMTSIISDKSKEDPILQWFVKDGAKLLCEVRGKLRIKNIEGLSALVCHLEYFSMPFSQSSDEEKVYSFLVDIPERLLQEFRDSDLLKDGALQNTLVSFLEYTKNQRWQTEALDFSRIGGNVSRGVVLGDMSSTFARGSEDINTNSIVVVSNIAMQSPHAAAGVITKNFSIEGKGKGKGGIDRHGLSGSSASSAVA